MMQSPEYLHSLFITGSKIGDLTIGETRQIGTVVLPSGLLVVCDPFIKSEPIAFEQKLAPGEYKVTAALLDAENKRPIATMLHIQEGTSVRFELALKPGQNRNEDTMFGFPSGAGTGAYMDLLATPTVFKDETFMAHAIGYDYENYASAVVDPVTKANIVVFQTGFGDGVYSSWWGFNENGEVVCLVTDLT